MIALDTSASMTYTSGGMSKLDYGISVASALAYFIMRQRDAVGLITFDDKLREFLPARCRQPHLMHLLRLLTQVSPGDQTDAARPLGDLAATLTKKSLVLLISDLLQGEEETIATLRNLRAMGHDVIVCMLWMTRSFTLPSTSRLNLSIAKHAKRLLQRQRRCAMPI